MNNLKKIGLTALGTAMISTGAHAASMDVSGATSIFFNGEDNSVKGNGWSMTDSVTFAASGEMDNGWSVSTSLEVDGAEGLNGANAGRSKPAKIAMMAITTSNSIKVKPYCLLLFFIKKSGVLKREFRFGR